MNSKKARKLRRIAKSIATDPYGTTNVNVNVKSVESGRKVMSNDKGYIPEMVPVVTYTSVLNDGCARDIYHDLKKEETNA